MSTVISELAEHLGEGWTGKDFSTLGDGQLKGPGGEVIWVKLYLGEASLDVDLLGVDRVPAYSQRTTDGEAFGNMLEAIRRLYPVWAEAHQQDLQRQEALPAAQEAFALSVAAHLGDGWEARVAGGWRDLEVSVQQGEHRIVWKPVEYAPLGKHKLAERLCLRSYGYRASITVGALRDAQAVAREITRRLLPQYAAEKAADDSEKARHAQAVEEVAKVVSIVKEHGAALGPSVPGYTSPDTEKVKVGLSAFNFGGGTLYGSVDCFSDGAYIKVEMGKLDEEGIKVVLGALGQAAATLQGGGG